MSINDALIEITSKERHNKDFTLSLLMLKYTINADY
jgi:hypothetical protein